MTESSPDPMEPSDVTHRAGWTALLPLGIAIASLLAVVAILLFVGRTTRGVREEVIEVVEPARNLLYDLQRQLALEEAELRGAAPARAPGTPADPEDLRAAQERTLARLRPLVRELDVDAAEALAEIRLLEAHWRARADAGAPREVRDARYLEVLAATDRLHRIIEREVQDRRRRIRDLERLETALVVGAILTALAAVMVMARLGRRQQALVEQARRLARESERRRRELERVAEEKAQFIRGVTHDLKNPIGAIDAYGQLLEAGIQGELSDGALDYVRRVRRAAREALGTIHDLLELARVDAGGISLDPRLTDVGSLVAGLVDDRRAAFEAAGLALSLEMPDAPPPIRTDPRRVREVLGNLLSNALKYASDGERVEVRVGSGGEGAPGPGRWVAVAVSDDGPGIPAEERERIFEEFHRLDGAGADGSGLGLAISRKVARLLGGDVSVESRVGEGSTFTLWLPAPGGEGEEAVSPGEGRAAGRR